MRIKDKWLLRGMGILRSIASKGIWITLPVGKHTGFGIYNKNKVIAGNQRENTERFEEHLADVALDGGFIEHQERMQDMKLGAYPLSFCGCETIAVYNAMSHLNPEGGFFKALPSIITYFEKRGVALAGEFGVDPRSLSSYFDEMGYRTYMTMNQQETLRIIKTTDVYIMTFYNNRKRLSDMIHTVCITKGKDGRLRAHNAGTKESYLNLQEMIRDLGVKGKAEMICFLGIRKPKA